MREGSGEGEGRGFRSKRGRKWRRNKVELVKEQHHQLLHTDNNDLRQ